MSLSGISDVWYNPGMVTGQYSTFGGNGFERLTTQVYLVPFLNVHGSSLDAIRALASGTLASGTTLFDWQMALALYKADSDSFPGALLHSGAGTVVHPGANNFPVVEGLSVTLDPNSWYWLGVTSNVDIIEEGMPSVTSRPLLAGFRNGLMQFFDEQFRSYPGVYYAVEPDVFPTWPDPIPRDFLRLYPDGGADGAPTQAAPLIQRHYSG